jgi:hypothetical protein
LVASVALSVTFVIITKGIRRATRFIGTLLVGMFSHVALLWFK